MRSSILALALGLASSVFAADTVSYEFAVAGADRTVVAYLSPVTETGLTPARRAFIRFVHPGPPPRRQAAGH